MLTGAFSRVILVGTDPSQVEEARSNGLALSTFGAALYRLFFAPLFATFAFAQTLGSGGAVGNPMVRCPAIEARAILIGVGLAVGSLAVGAFALFIFALTFARIGGRQRN